MEKQVSTYKKDFSVKREKTYFFLLLLYSLLPGIGYHDGLQDILFATSGGELNP